jgi:hypothetical protein
MDPVAIVADVSEMETRPPAYPEHVAALEARGFRVIGRFATLNRPSQDDLAYARQERARLDHWRQRTAATALAAPDGSSFAGVDTVGEARMLRLRSELDDGSVVETLGIERDGVLQPRFGRDPLAAFRYVLTPDHSVRVLEDPSPDAVIAEHADHVAVTAARRGAQPVRHVDRDHALRLASMHADHMSRVVHRGRRLGRLILFAVFVVLAVAMLTFQVATDSSLTATLLFDVCILASALAAVLGVARMLTRSSWWRPPYLPDH